MQIKWIELNGFKSFPDKTKIDIKEGITCFVGPNGAGKSNIVDAFRWILGEHSPRTLRGEKMEEIIFQGSDSKKEKGLAEVSMLLNIEEKTHNGNEPVFREIEIKRRFYRTGESYFIINGKTSRLKNIREIFLTEGVDLRTYAIIDQTKISELLSKASHRKALLEECAGISLYKMKKTESELKLDAAKENLQRIEDILRELKNQYFLLERQAKRAERYKKILSEMTELELKFAKSQSLSLLEILENLEKELEALENKYQDLKNRNGIITKKIEEQKNKISEIDNYTRKIEAENKQKDLEIAKLEKELALLYQEEKNKKETLEKLKEENALLSDEMERLKAEMRENYNLIKEMEKKLVDLKKEIILYEENLIEFHSKLANIEKSMENERKALFNLTTELTNKRNLYNSLKKSLENNQNRLVSIRYKKDEIKHKIESMEIENEKAERLIKDLHESLQNQNNNLKNIQNQIVFLEKNLEEENKKLIEKKKEEATIKGKIEALTSAIGSEEGEGKIFFKCIDVSSEVEDLVEIFLDEKLKATVVEKIEAIKPTEKRKYFFLKTLPRRQKRNIPPDLQTLKNFIKVREENLNIDIFENIVIVEDLKEAIEKREKLPDFTFITKKGEVFYPDGFVKTGKGEDLLKKKRILQSLQTEKEKISNEIEALEKNLFHLRAEVEKLREVTENKKNLINKLNKDIFIMEEKQKNSRKEIEISRQRLSFMEKEERAIREEIEREKKNIDNLKIQINDLSVQIEETEENSEKLKEERLNILKENEDKKEILSSKKIELSALKERLNSKNTEILRIQENLKRNSLRKRKNDEEIKKTLYKLEELKNLQTDKRNIMQVLKEDIENLKKQKNEYLEILSQEKERLFHLEKEYYALNEDLQNITTLIGEKKAQKREANIKLETLWNEIYNLYGKDILKEEIDPVDDYSFAKDKIEALKTQLKNLGPVDVEILKEYEEVKKRYDFMLEQQRDIKTSIEELEEAIRKINNLTRKKLKETFELLKEKFNSLFQELFSGGKAVIYLTKEDNILESELEINVQPPGKKMSSINLLSGGEKALTAIAFIFACLAIRPSPICILDEVDAPLDDPNTIRLRNLIKKMVEKTQFLIITHNKLMMEAADYIYGVTMKEEGVSSIISLELREAENYV